MKQQLEDRYINIDEAAQFLSIKKVGYIKTTNWKEFLATTSEED